MAVCSKRQYAAYEIYSFLHVFFEEAVVREAGLNRCTAIVVQKADQHQAAVLAQNKILFQVMQVFQRNGKVILDKALLSYD